MALQTSIPGSNSRAPPILNSVNCHLYGVRKLIRRFGTLGNNSRSTASIASVRGSPDGRRHLVQTSATTVTKKFQSSRWRHQLVVRLPEGTRELTVPEDSRFTVDRKSLSVHELRAGMAGAARITTRTTVTPVTGAGLGIQGNKITKITPK